jgi:hypothetical protein
MATDVPCGDQPPALHPVATALDGATRDSAVSGDAMRWSPDLADSPPGLPVGPATGGAEALPGVDAAVGLGTALGLDGVAMQRLVTGALFALPGVPGTGRRQLTAGPAGAPGPEGTAGE